MLISRCAWFRSRAQVNSSRRKSAACLKANFVTLKAAAVVFGFLAPMRAGIVGATDLHPIIEIETGYFFGASERKVGQG